MHWTLTANAEQVKKRISERKKQNPKRFEICKNAAQIRLEKNNGTSWNDGLPKEKQPRYGKPISEKQGKALKIGREETPHKKPWYTGISEWSPILAMKEIRKQALIRAQDKCEICQSTKNIVIHHKQHWEQLKDWNLIHSLENLEVLCRKCHVRLHIQQKKKIYNKQ